MGKIEAVAQVIEIKEKQIYEDWQLFIKTW